jgi:hypothetical protein
VGICDLNQPQRPGDASSAAFVSGERRHGLTIRDDDVARLFARPQRLQYSEARRQIGHEHSGCIDVECGEQHPR